MRNSEFQLKDLTAINAEEEDTLFSLFFNSTKNFSSVETKDLQSYYSHFENFDKERKITKRENYDSVFFSHFINSSRIDTNYIVSEERINEERVLYLDREVSPLLISYIKNEDFEFGQNCESIRVVEKELGINKTAAQAWFNQLYLRYFKSNEAILIGLLRILEYIGEDLYPMGQTIAIASLSHKDNEVKELGVRILETSISLDNYNILKNILVDTKWLQDYIDQVIKDFEKELCLY